MTRKQNTTTADAYIAGLLGWILPGAGHWFLGLKKRAVILCIAISLTFWIGIAIGGAFSTVNPAKSQPWFIAQICAGAQPIVSMLLGKAGTEYISSGRTLDLARLYTGVAGMLNVLAICDAIKRAARTQSAA